MACDKCEHVHEAKLECPCKCHELYVIDYTTATSDGNVTFTCGINGCESFKI